MLKLSQLGPKLMSTYFKNFNRFGVLRLDRYYCLFVIKILANYMQSMN